MLQQLDDNRVELAHHITESGSYYSPWLYMKRSDRVHMYPMYDGTGNTRKLVDSGGGGPAAYTYDAFGKYQYGWQNVQNPYRYGGAWDYVTDSSGMLQLGARFYWPEIGRFVQQDPLRLRRNRYAYVRSNPVRYVDPYGLCEIFGVAEGELAALVGVDFSLLATIDLSQGWESGLYKSQGQALGLSAGVGAGLGFALRDVEGYATNFDANIPVPVRPVLSPSLTASWDERGLNALAGTVGPGAGAAGSFTETTPILTAGQVREDVSSLWQDLTDIWWWLTKPSDACP